MKTRAIALITSGIQREMTFAHSDHSFSAFGNQDNSGSMWLTGNLLAFGCFVCLSVTCSVRGESVRASFSLCIHRLHHS